MKFKIDENLPQETADFFKREGFDALTVLEQGMGGSTDEQLISICRQEKRALVTLDLDFSDIRAYPPSSYEGIILLRISNQSKANIMRLLEQVPLLLKQEPLVGQLWIIETERIRIRE